MPDPIEATRAEVFWRVHRDLPQQGPGSDASTRRAIDLARPLPTSPRILDLGCGPGRQTLVLAEELGGEIVALDLLQPFLDQLERRAKGAGHAARIETRQASMGDLSPRDHPDRSVDLIWSEGAIYNVGFDEGLAHWRRVLTDEGRVAVTEVSWLVDSPAADIEAFWRGHYPAMRSREANVRAIRAAGYRVLDHFVLSEQEWWTGYYDLIEERVGSLRDERQDEAWQSVVAEFDAELEAVRTGLRDFGYVFYVMAKEGA